MRVRTAVAKRDDRDAKYRSETITKFNDIQFFAFAVTEKSVTWHGLILINLI